MFISCYKVGNKYKCVTTVKKMYATAAGEYLWSTGCLRYGVTGDFKVDTDIEGYFIHIYRFGYSCLHIVSPHADY